MVRGRVISGAGILFGLCSSAGFAFVKFKDDRFVDSNDSVDGKDENKPRQVIPWVISYLHAAAVSAIKQTEITVSAEPNVTEPNIKSSLEQCLLPLRQLVQKNSVVTSKTMNTNDENKNSHSYDRLTALVSIPESVPDFSGKWCVYLQEGEKGKADENSMDEMLSYLDTPYYLVCLNRLGNSCMEVKMSPSGEAIHEEHSKFGGLYTGNVDLVMDGSPRSFFHPLSRSKVTTRSTWREVTVAGKVRIELMGYSILLFSSS
uniref:Uncharacterized protein n=1 Tax=Aplanochytrium stocchinoi TaxID=215587 RepID=A0A7S3PDH6_9STRA|mmetsp:Transcript_35246/g.43500  ORF Transcript_35246/g.43500 Transcript_35246/m.43500 type:complete len:260 (-) Transcript_35246:78-857(-)